MKSKKIIRIALLLFVLAGIGGIISKEFINKSTNLVETEEIKTETLPSDRVLVYYFHGHTRCPSCITIENYTKEAVEKGFPEELTSKKIIFQEVNVQEQSNEHYVTEFELTNSTVVIARYNDDKQTDWKKLNEVWQLYGNKPEFIDFIQSEIKNILSGVS